jgi:hypothetical protein
MRPPRYERSSTNARPCRSFVAGDLFVNRYVVQAFAHGSNCSPSQW